MRARFWLLVHDLAYGVAMFASERVVLRSDDDTTEWFK
jgi:hypothetical protein